jgi:hypothetical protein
VADASRDVEIDILARDKTGPGVKSAASNFDKLGDQVRKTTSKIAGEAAGAGTKAGSTFGQSLVTAFGRAAPGLAPVLAGVAIAAAPVMGASVAAAVIGGAGIGGVVGGVLIASRDARVQSAAKDLGDTIMRQLERSAVVFVNPILQATGQIRGAFVRAGTDIEQIFRKSATFVQPLTAGATYAFERITRGVNQLVQAAGPVITALRDGMANVGEAVEDVFSSLSDNGVEAASALNVAFGALEVTIRAVGATVNALAEAYGFLAKWGAFGKDVALQYRAMEVSAKHAKEANDETSGSFQRVQEATAGAVAKIREYNEIVNEGKEIALSQAEARARATVATIEATERIKDNNKEITNSTERNAQNMVALTGLARQLESARVATEKMYGAGKQATQVAAQNRAAFIAAAQAAGYSKQKAEELADAYLGIPPKVSTKAELDKAAVDRKLADLEARLNWATRPRTATVTVTWRQRNEGVKVPGGTLTKWDANHYFRATDLISGGAQRSRAGGPTPVSVTSEVRVDLDGRPFRDYTAHAIDDNDSRRRYRELVGKR